MKNGKYISHVVLTLLGLLAWERFSLAGITIQANGSAQIYAGAGASTPSIDRIDFTVTGANVGSGTQVAGLENGSTTSTLVDAYARAPASNSRTAVWTVDSSQPMVCATPATSGTTTIPMTKFRWVTVNGTEIASGSFNGSTSQALMSFKNSRYVYVYKTYYYLNDVVVPAGRYTGRVVYTVAMP